MTGKCPVPTEIVPFNPGTTDWRKVNWRNVDWSCSPHNSLREAIDAAESKTTTSYTGRDHTITNPGHKKWRAGVGLICILIFDFCVHYYVYQTPKKESTSHWVQEMKDIW